ncbi:MAG: hypothetical protein KBH99_07820 [Syntrophobacteraceae bacterium]|nr:hypothetical protein [Syntrophobacteraceae bacterium]HOV87318.1 hypothetical protein [Syntrophobacteraceae bacterium]
MSGLTVKQVARRELVAREFLCMLFLSVALMAVSLISPVGYAPLGLEPQAGGEVSAPWLVVWLQVLLRYFPPLLAGIFFPLLILALITFLPWLPRAGEEIPRRLYYWGIHQIAFWVLGGAFAFLTFWGL